MNHAPKYSVIIPVYNAADTLRRCLDSLLCQPFDDYEIILVNDGSTDDSEAICRAYAEGCRRVRLLSRPNGGVSSARNAGLELALGTYILFVDSDDYVSERLFSVLEELDREAPWDLILCSNYRTDGTGVSVRQLPDERSGSGIDTARLLSQAYWRKTINQPWAKRYRLELIRALKLRFHEGLSIGEDKLFNLRYALACTSCRLTSEKLYYVNTSNENSLSRKPRSDLEQQLSLLDGQIRRQLLRQDVDPECIRYYQEAENFFRFRGVYARTKRMHREGIPRPQRMRAIRQMCRELSGQHLPVPRSRFCMAVCLPVRLRLTWLIDLTAARLAG